MRITSDRRRPTGRGPGPARGRDPARAARPEVRPPAACAPDEQRGRRLAGRVGVCQGAGALCGSCLLWDLGPSSPLPILPQPSQTFSPGCDMLTLFPFCGGEHKNHSAGSTHAHKMPKMSPRENVPDDRSVRVIGMSCRCWWWPRTAISPVSASSRSHPICARRWPRRRCTKPL